MVWEVTEAIRQQALARKAAGYICHHGNALGVSSWDTPFCQDCETEAYNAALAEDDAPEVCCAICDAVGHGQPGYGPCPLEVNYDLRYETEEEEKRAAWPLVDPEDIAF